ncbi:MAG: uroporphyrinogen-III C-methyltransferase [Candidatus Methanomethylicia archaeon]|nr:uroporphyrinogen-III C-methyltransferase [Candidatus Methanomethylicia archaeon]
MKGKVYLVGAGVLGVENLTIRAHRIISEADVILYDRLVDPSVVGLAKPGAEVVYVGKEPGEGPQKQKEVTEMMINYVNSGKNVVRLKSGDPFVFGRGGEELLSLRKANVDVEVVPGLTSAVAIPTLAGIPLTMRGLSSSVTILSGHLSEPEEESYFKEHARFPGTMVLLMSLTNLSRISKYLIEGGMSPDKPVAVITNTGRKNSLEKEYFKVGDLVRREDRREGPGVVVIGEVVGAFMG